MRKTLFQVKRKKNKTFVIFIPTKRGLVFFTTTPKVDSNCGMAGGGGGARGVPSKKSSWDAFIGQK